MATKTEEILHEALENAQINLDCAESIEADLEARIDKLEAALRKLTNGNKYSAEVCQIAREALSDQPEGNER